LKKLPTNNAAFPGPDSCLYPGNAQKSMRINRERCPLVIELIDVVKGFDGRVVINGLSLVIPERKITAIIGLSGEGKSVLLKLLIGLLHPESGRILIDGVDIAGMAEHDLKAVRQKFGMLFQGAALLDSLTVFDNLALPLVEKHQLSAGDIAQRVHKVLEEVGLKGVDDKYPDKLSGGMNKRVGLARALILEPKIMLFDEPTTGLDPITDRAIHTLIQDTQKQFGYTAVIVSHDIPAIFSITDLVAMIYQGRIVEQGTPEEIQHSENPVVRQFISGKLDGPIHIV
jgi:phospholipid/cholesterol/gamma-HCH transport system ATP-binding protein